MFNRSYGDTKGTYLYQTRVADAGMEAHKLKKTKQNKQTLMALASFRKTEMYGTHNLLMIMLGPLGFQMLLKLGWVG